LFIKSFSNSNLAYLTIFNNPVASSNGIRGKIARCLHNLLALDFNAISDEERYDYIFLPDNCPFKMMNQKSKV